MSDLRDIRNIGEKMAGMLVQVGIADRESLEKIGAAGAQLRLLQAGKANHFFYYQALKLGLMGRAWNDVDGDEKALIRSEFKALQEKAKAEFIASSDQELPPLLARSLREIGVL